MKKQEIDQMENGQEQEVSTGRKILDMIVNVILVAAIVVAAFCTYVSYVSTSGNGVPSVLGIEVFSIQTDSMYPELQSGDLVIARAVEDPSTLRVKDIVTYWTVINGERVLNTHRIHQIYDGGGYLIFETKGDANTIADPLTVHESEIVGIYMTHIDGVGKFFDYLQTSTGFMVVIVIPVFLFFLYHLVQFFRVLFEYQNIKNRLKYEEERGNTEEFLEKKEQELQNNRERERAAIEAELREKLKAELLAEVAKAQNASAPAQPAAPAAQTPAAEPVAEKPVAEEPVAEEPVAEEPVAEEPVAEEPVAEEPVAEEPVVEEPVAEEPVAEEPVAEEPVVEEPVVEEPVVEEPVVEEPVVEEPVVEEPVSEEDEDDDYDDDDDGDYDGEYPEDPSEYPFEVPAE